MKQRSVLRITIYTYIIWGTCASHDYHTGDAESAQPRKASNVTRPFSSLRAGPGNETNVLGAYSLFAQVCVACKFLRWTDGRAEVEPRFSGKRRI